MFGMIDLAFHVLLLICTAYMAFKTRKMHEDEAEVGSPPCCLGECKCLSAWVGVCVCACVCAAVRAWVRAAMRGCVGAWVPCGPCVRCVLCRACVPCVLPCVHGCVGATVRTCVRATYRA